VDWLREGRRPERIVNSPPTASHPLAGLRHGGKTVEKRHRVLRRTGAVVEAACSISANPHCSVQRFYRVSEARVAPDRDRLWFPGLEHCCLYDRYRAEPARRRRGLPIGLHQGRRCRRPQQRDIPVHRVAPGRRNVATKLGTRFAKTTCGHSLARRQSAAGWARSAPGREGRRITFSGGRR
jgi:hypothetical protein